MKELKDKWRKKSLWSDSTFLVLLEIGDQAFEWATTPCTGDCTNLCLFGSYERKGPRGGGDGVRFAFIFCMCK